MYQLNSYSNECPTAKEIALLLSPAAKRRAIPIPNGNGVKVFWCAQCPAHDDDQNSLRLQDGPNGVQMFCHAGCLPSHVRAYVYREIANKAVVKDSSRKVISIERKEQIKRSVAEIKRHSADLVYICLDWAKWKIQEFIS